MVIKGSASLFADWTVILNANNCLSKGYDVYLENPCDHWNRKHVYGEIILNIPSIRTFPKFFYFYFPIIFNVIFLYTLVDSIFDLDNKKFWLLFLVFIFSIPTILVIERGNIDLIIFIFLYLISKYNNYTFNYILIIFSSIIKIYPILLSTIFIFEKNFKKVLINLILISVLFLILMGMQFESLIKIFENQSQFTGYGYGLYEFSFLGAIKFFSSFNLNFDNSNLNWIKYLYGFLFVLFPLIILNYFFSNKISFIFSNFDFDKNSSFEKRLYFLSSTIILFCYLFFSNFVYREIFLIGLVPAILSLQKNKDSFLSFYFCLLLIKFLITSIFIYLFQNEILNFLNPFMIIIKHTVDLFLISLILHVYIKLIIFYFRRNIFVTEF
tara:strand:- start:2597 stop:3745 length:1149 start_codon:yes stop_codon:yes gene_type:complete